MSEPYLAKGGEAMLALEAMVDKVGLRNVVYALACICEDKAEHLRANWQDPGSAVYWENDAHKLDAIASRLNSH